ncbi:HAD hydrolase-like protein [Paracoccus cavernae]|uniref:phosphoglycolate phosphatase n=1 Tax=Paracoccus cavernae TaxID=1571207 RepID=A0ABT8DCD5_9RHOB|nr:HAD hydrolase-like protein [Paracoccus cavernae]
MRHIEAILFDCDGVLLDSEPMRRALAQALTAAGYPMTIDEARAVFSGNAAHDSRDWMAARGLLADEIVRESDRLLFEQFDQHVPLIPGIERIMSGFSVPMAICSNASIERLKRSVHRTSLAPRFGPNIYSAEHVARPKPAADLALYACARLGVPLSGPLHRRQHPRHPLRKSRRLPRRRLYRALREPDGPRRDTARCRSESCRSRHGAVPRTLEISDDRNP